MPREPTVNVIRADDHQARTFHRNTFTSSERSGQILGHLRYTPMVSIRCSACKGQRLVGDPSNPGPHAPHHVGGYLVDCIGRIVPQESP